MTTSTWTPSKWFAEQFPNWVAEERPVDPWVVEAMRAFADEYGTDGVVLDGEPLADWLARLPLERRH